MSQVVLSDRTYLLIDFRLPLFKFYDNLEQKFEFLPVAYNKNCLHVTGPDGVYKYSGGFCRHDSGSEVRNLVSHFHLYSSSFFPK